MPVIVPPYSVIRRSGAGSALNELVGWPGTGEPDELGAGMSNSETVPETPDTPSRGSIDSALCPNGE